MKKILILTVVATIAAFSFAQSARSLKPGEKFSVQRVMTSADLSKAAKVKLVEQAKTEKAETASKTNANQPKAADRKSSPIFHSPTAKVVSKNTPSRMFTRNAMPKAKADSKIEQKDEHGIIIAPAEGDTTYYKRSGSCHYYDNNICYDTQKGHVTIVECENGDVYIKDPVSRFAADSWVKGVKKGNTITVPTRQPLAYSQDYKVTVSLGWTAYNSDWEIVAAENPSDHFTFTIAGDVITLEGTSDTLFMGILWDDNDEALNYCDYETVWTADPGYKPTSKVPVTIPEGLVTETWYGRGKLMSYGGDKYQKPLTVGFDGSDVYVQGLFNEFPEAWIKGKIENNVATFPSMQYFGVLYGYHIWATGVEFVDGYEPVLEDFVMNFDEATKTYTAVNILVENSAETELSYVEGIMNLKIMAEEPYYGPTTVPYFNPLNTEELMDEFVVVDANDDGYTWSFYELDLDDAAARYGYSYYDADDWLITRGIELKASNAYSFGFDTRGQGYSERIEVKMGKAQTAAAMTLDVIPATDFDIVEYQHFENDRITVPEDGVYYFGIHAISDADKYNIYVKNVSVGEGLLPYSPAAAENLTLVPAADGSNVATISFDAPTKDINGNPLKAGTSLSIKVYRGEELIKTLTANLGQHMSFTDEVAEAGLYTYKIIAFAGDVNGDKAVITGWVGLDIPAEVTNATITDNITSITATWDPVTSVGANGGVVLPESTTYNFCNVEMYEMFGVLFPEVEEPINTEPITGTTFTTDMKTCEGDQAIVYYAVQAQNATGKNNGTIISMLKGAPYKLSIHESFAGSFSYFWDYSQSSDFCGAYPYKDPSDDDSYCMELGSWSEKAEWVRFESGKIALEGAKNATLSFDAKKDSNNEVMKVLVLRSTGELVEMETLKLTEEYAPYKISLAEFKDDLWVRFFILAEFEKEGYVEIDNITVSDLYDTNVSITVSALLFVTAGTNALVKAIVKNEGSTEAKGYAVKFYANNELFAELGASETVALTTNKTAEYTVAYETSVFAKAGDVTFRAEVVLDGDMKPEDNAAETSFAIILPASSPVASVDAQSSEDGVDITWTAPQDAVAEVVENFDSYEGNTIYRDGEYCGNWKAVDVSKGLSFGWNNLDITWPYTNQVFAFGIIDTEATNLRTLAKLSALSGVNSLAFFSEYDEETGEDKKSDRYVISPELNGVAQKIVFGVCIYTNAYGDDTFEVLASSTDTNVESFTKVAEFSQKETGWHYFSADLPQGTKYFAIRYTSNCTFGMLVDDITYLADATPTGYNVYVDGKLVTTTDPNTLSFTYPEKLEGSHSVSVTALYDENESIPVTVEIGGSGIKEIESETGEVVIYNISGVRVSPNKLEKGIYIINGEKRAVK